MAVANEKVLLLANVESDGTLAKAVLESLAAAKSVSEMLSGSTLSVGLTGADQEAIKKSAASIAACGAQQFFGATDAQFAQSRYATDAAAAEALCRAAGATIVVAAGTSRWSRIAAGLAYRLGGRADTHITAIEGANGSLVATRWYYRQRMFGKVSRAARPWVLTVDPSVYQACPSQPGTATVQPVAVTLPEPRTTVTGTKEPPASQQTIRPDAELLFVAGAGWTKKQRSGQSRAGDAEKLILGFLQKTQASLGGSKSVVDQAGEGQDVLKFMTHLNQVGQTGATPRHAKGLSTCCHGEEPHVVGWRFVTERRAVNLDPNCGWAHGKADVLYVADAFEVMEKVNALLS